MTIHSSLNDVLVATEALLLATRQERDVAVHQAIAEHARHRETTHRANILAIRCAEQAKMIAALLAKYEPSPLDMLEASHRGRNASIHAAIATMQRQGVR